MTRFRSTPGIALVPRGRNEPLLFLLRLLPACFSAGVGALLVCGLPTSALDRVWFGSAMLLSAAISLYAAVRR